MGEDAEEEEKQEEEEEGVDNERMKLRISVMGGVNGRRSAHDPDRPWISHLTIGSIC